MGTKSKVLIVDDDPAFTKLVGHYLREAGYEVAVAADGMQGLMFAKRDHPDLVLVDLQMPAGGGMQLLDRLHTNRATETIPKVIVTASRDQSLEAKARDHGAAGFLHKPVDQATLLAAVHAALPEPETDEE
ncbi:MAG TPA: response regulator [Gemmatimonadales bacterium]|nr:response regulator [Gemmatimonadales bacterium]